MVFCWPRPVDNSLEMQCPSKQGHGKRQRIANLDAPHDARRRRILVVTNGRHVMSGSKLSRRLLISESCKSHYSAVYITVFVNESGRRQFRTVRTQASQIARVLSGRVLIESS